MILLSAGHYPESQGACYNEFCEYEEAEKWVDIMEILLRGRVETKRVPAWPLLITKDTPPQYKQGKINFINAQTTAKLAVEIHFNSDTSHSARGSETLYCPGSVKGRHAARAVQDAISSLLGPNRGAKEGWYRMDKPGHIDYPGDVEGDEKIDAFLGMTRPVALIIEPEFIHNRLVIESLRQVVCEVMADALVEIVNNL